MAIVICTELEEIGTNPHKDTEQFFTAGRGGGGEGRNARGLATDRPGAAHRSGLNGATENSSHSTAASNYFMFLHSVRVAHAQQCNTGN